MFSFLFFPIIFFNAPFISFRFTIFVSFSYKPNLEIIYYYEKIHFSFCAASSTFLQLHKSAIGWFLLDRHCPKRKRHKNEPASKEAGSFVFYSLPALLLAAPVPLSKLPG